MNTVCRNFFYFCVLTVSFFAAGAVSAYGASSDWFARVWQSDDGLPDNSVTGVAQTSDGYLWVATQSGLVRFDGVQFKRVSLPNVSGTRIEMIREMTVCKGDHLWLALEGGVVVSATPKGTKIYTAAQGLPVIRPSSITEDADGTVWVGYWDDTACRIADGEVKRFTGKDGLPFTGFCSLVTDGKKQLWFAEGNHVGVFRNGRFVSLISMPERPACISARRSGGLWICAGQSLFNYQEGREPMKVAQLTSTSGAVDPLTLFEDRSGAVWIGTAASGLFRFDGTNVIRVETSRGEIRSVTEDREGDIWVGTTGAGLNRLRPRALQLYGMEHGLPFETVQSVCEDTDGSLWVVTQNGSVAHSRGESWLVVSTNANWPGGQASCVASDGRGAVWIGTADSGLYRWENGGYTIVRKQDGLASDKVWALMEDSASNLWVAMSVPSYVQRLRAGKLENFGLPSGSRVVRAMVEDAAHVIWMGTEDGRLLRVNGHELVDETARTLARPIPIRCLQATPDGSLWIGYAGAGVGRLKNQEFVQIGMEQGLPDDFISQIMPDDHGRLWFAGNSGVFAVRQEQLEEVAEGRVDRVRAVIFGKNEGLPSLQANFGYGPAAVRTRDGRICFSMLTGLAVVSPDKIRVNSLPPPVVVERISVDGRTLTIPGASQLLGGELKPAGISGSDRVPEVPPQHHELKIDFNALSLVSPENVRFRYQLAGYNQKWIETTQRSVTYSQMPPGQYRFHVTACNNSGVWNQTGAVLSFVVRPFFWQTWWFRLGLITVFTIGTAAIVYYISFRRLRQKLLRLEQETAVQKDRARIAKDLHDDLGAHLSQIAMLSELAQADLEKPVQASGHIDQIFRNAQLLTRSLDEIVWAVNPRNDTLDRFVAHVCQFAPEFLRTAGIRSRLDMPMDLPPVELAANVRHQMYLGLKEALHNVIKHAGATEVWLRLAVTPDALTLVVEDNGRGFVADAVRREGEDGLINLRHRMEEIGGYFKQESTPEQGTRITFVAPVNGKTL